MEVLFVDDETAALDGLRRSMRRVRPKWSVRFAPGAKEALDQLAESPVDVVVSDLRMPKMDGVQLLAEVSLRHPSALRVVLTGEAGSPLLFDAIGLVHRVLGKPCEPEALVAAVEAAAVLRDKLFTPKVVQALSGAGALPRPPRIYSEIERAIREEKPISELGRLIGGDPVLSGRLLQLVNSAWFGARRRIESIPQAISQLGLQHTKTMALSLSMSDTLNDGRDPQVEGIFDHAARVAAASETLARAACLSPQEAEECFSAGLLHDVGRLVVAAKMPEANAAVAARMAAGCPCRCYAEVEELGATHGAIGALLLSLWGVPDVIVDVVHRHCDDPPWSNASKSLLIVAAAEAATGSDEDPDYEAHWERLKPQLAEARLLDVAEALRDQPASSP